MITKQHLKKIIKLNIRRKIKIELVHITQLIKAGERSQLNIKLKRSYVLCVINNIATFEKGEKALK